MPRHSRDNHTLSRRTLLKGLGVAPLLLRPSPLHGYSLLFGSAAPFNDQDSPFHFSDVRLTPHYPVKSPLEGVLRLVPPGSDEYVTEKYAFEIESVLGRWSAALRKSIHDDSVLANALDEALEASSLIPAKEVTLRHEYGINVVRREFDAGMVPGKGRFLHEMQTWLAPFSRIDVAEFQITAIEETTSGPLSVQVQIRYDIAGDRIDKQREVRIGAWHTEWVRNETGTWRAKRWKAGEETLSRASEPVFLDVTQQALGGTDS